MMMMMFFFAGVELFLSSIMEWFKNALVCSFKDIPLERWVLFWVFRLGEDKLCQFLTGRRDPPYLGDSVLF
jgi:hypothetical protein